MVLIRRIVAFLGCGSLLVALGVLTAPTASATVTTLCTGYTACVQAGMSDSGYGTAGRSMYWRMYAGHNCTNYAAYRMVRSGLANSRPWTGSGNATNWGVAMHSITNGTPMVGAVAWWKAGVKPAGSVGHVAYVERVVSSSEIIVSMDSWHGNFSWARVTRTTSGWPSGFIHFNDVRLRTTVAPKVTGTAKVGSVLTASAGTWTPSPTTLTYRWLANGVAIAGAVSSSFTPTSAQVGKVLTAQVTATGLGYPTASAVSAPTAAVQPGVLSNTARPGIDGQARVGETLTGEAGTWTPTPDHLTYQWLADDTELPGAVAQTLDLGADLVGKKITLRVTATKAGYPTAVATSAPLAPVAPGSFDVATSPRVGGVARPGQVLTVTRPSVSPAPAVAIQWLRNGVPVAGATGSSYRVSTADLGAHLAARLRLTRAGYTSTAVASAATPLVRALPVLRVATTPGVRRLTVHATVRAPGVSAVQGVLRVRSRGGFERELAIRSGAVQATLTGLPTGTRTYRFRVVRSTTLLTAMVARRVAVR